MNDRTGPIEPTVIIPWWMDCHIEGLRNPYDLHIVSDTIEGHMDRIIEDFVTTGRGITRIDPADFYKEHLSKDADNE